MIRLLMVDDEPTTIKRIHARVDFQALGITEIKEAENGDEAIEICRDWQPDILLSDIMMPRMNGIELAEKLREFNPSLQIIFLSGYMEKDFLKGAIHLQAINYIEKPIDMDELTETLRRAIERIEYREGTSKRLVRLGDEYTNSLKRSLAIELSSENYHEHIAERYFRELFPDRENLPCFALQLKFYRPEEKRYSVLASFLPVIQGIAEKQALTAASAVKYDYIAIFLIANESKKNSDKVFFVSEFLRELRKELVLQNIRYTAGTGHVCSDWRELHTSFEEAMEATRLAFFHHPGYHSYYRQSAKRFDFAASGAIQKIRDLKKNGRDSTVFQMREINAELERCEGTDPEDVKRFYSSLVIELYQMAKEDGIRLFTEYPGEHDLLIVVMEQNFLVELFDFLLMGIETYCNFLEKDYYQNATVNWIIRYIHEHYSDPDLDMMALSAASNLSATYISHLFKSTTGRTVRNYITDYRMKQAVTLLKNPINQVNDIAVRCGYRNGNYFSYRFKEYFGVAPTEYKEQGETS